MRRIDLQKVYDRLYRWYGPQKWWPTSARGYEARCLEICIGAILTQNTNWTNVEKALANLRGAKALSFIGLRALPRRTLARLIRPSGYYNQKALKLQAFLTFVTDAYDGSFRKMFRQPTMPLRRQLLSVHGIGKETADSMLLYAGGKPIFVVDTYTKRLLAEQEVFFSEYDEYRAFFERVLRKSAKLFQEFHALIVAYGKEPQRGSTGRS